MSDVEKLARLLTDTVSDIVINHDPMFSVEDLDHLDDLKCGIRECLRKYSDRLSRPSAPMTIEDLAHGDVWCPEMGDRRKATTPVVTREQILDRLSRCWISLPGFNADIVEAQANEIMALLSGATVVVDREKLLKFFAQYHVPKAAEEITDNFIASGLLSTKGEG